MNSSNANLQKLEMLRSDIDKINEEIIKLFSKRLKISKEIAHCKKKSHLPLLDKKREEIQNQSLKALAKKHQLSHAIISEIFTIFIDYCRMEMKMEIEDETDYARA